MIPLILIFLILIETLIITYTYNILNRVFKTKRKTLYLILSVLIGIICLDVKSTFIIILLHFYIISFITDIILKLLKKKNNKYFIIPITITLIIFVYGYINMRNIVKTEYTVYTDKLNEDIKLLYISDSHYPEVLNSKTLNKKVNEINKENIDIVLLGGDLIDEGTTKDEMNELFNTLGKLKSKYGTYYVYGNHDEQNYSSNKLYTKEDLAESLDKNNITLLQDEYININENIVLIGRKDISVNRKNISDIYKKQDNEYIITLDHQPTEYKENKEIGVDLILSGHTHAGQIFPVGLIIDIFNTSEMSYGHKKDDTLNAIVSSGIAGWGFKIRTSRHSEYVIVNIKSNTI